MVGRRKTVDGRRNSRSDPGIVVDATGLLCPIPVLRLEKALREVRDGTIVMLKATDPAAREDVEVFCRERGHTLFETTSEGGTFRFVIRRRA